MCALKCREDELVTRGTGFNACGLTESKLNKKITIATEAMKKCAKQKNLQRLPILAVDSNSITAPWLPASNGTIS